MHLKKKLYAFFSTTYSVSCLYHLKWIVFLKLCSGCSHHGQRRFVWSTFIWWARTNLGGAVMAVNTPSFTSSRVSITAALPHLRHLGSAWRLHWVPAAPFRAGRDVQANHDVPLQHIRVLQARLATLHQGCVVTELTSRGQVDAWSPRFGCRAWIEWRRLGVRVPRCLWRWNNGNLNRITKYKWVTLL